MSQTILVAEGELVCQSVFGHILRSRGYAVIEVHTGAEALAASLAASEPIDLAIIDSDLADAFGTQVAVRLRQHFPHLPILLTSGTPIEWWMPKTKAEMAQLAGVVEFLPKPFRAAVLSSKVASMLHSAGAC